ncbi:MAG: fructosamine kinase family protein [Chloroflexi bacterium]|nr:fructosamine kinase family protein [Chloroflexota bacterium]
MLPKEVLNWLENESFGEIVNTQPVGGGCINNGVRLETSSGSIFFLKTNAQSPKNMFARESEGLEALRVPEGPRIPQAYIHGFDYLLLEDLSPATRSLDYWTTFGRQLAALHEHTNKKFGFDANNYIGSTPQSNTWTEDGFAFFAEHRLGFQAELAHNKDLLSASEVSQVERIANRLPEIIPEQPASLIHGDLWGGNAIADSQGQPALIDPAVYYGWAEAELAMTALFGGFNPDFYSAYEDTRPLSPGYLTRFPLYNLYHLLNHLNLFGRGYYGQVKTILDKYA